MLKKVVFGYRRRPLRGESSALQLPYGVKPRQLSFDELCGEQPDSKQGLEMEFLAALGPRAAMTEYHKISSAVGKGETTVGRRRNSWYWAHKERSLRELCVHPSALSRMVFAGRLELNVFSTRLVLLRECKQKTAFARDVIFRTTPVPSCYENRAGKEIARAKIAVTLFAKRTKGRLVVVTADALLQKKEAEKNLVECGDSPRVKSYTKNGLEKENRVGSGNRFSSLGCCKSGRVKKCHGSAPGVELGSAACKNVLDLIAQDGY